MKFSKLILPILALSISTASFAQEKRKVPVLNDGISLNSKIFTYIATHAQNVLDTQCGYGCFFVDFRINDAGNVCGIESNDGAWKTLDTLVRSALLSTNGQWKKPGAAETGKVFLLPVMYNTGHCSSDSLSKRKLSGEKTKDPETMPKIDKSGMMYSFMHMTDFDHSEKEPRFFYFMTDDAIECTLLSPIYLTASKS